MTTPLPLPAVDTGSHPYINALPTPLTRPTVVLFFGGGQDSTDLLYRYFYDAAFRQRYVGDAHFLVIMSDTGNEYPGTYSHVRQIKAFCERNSIEFYLITTEMGYHGKTWPSLQGQMERNHNVMGVAFPKSCTDNLKIKPCYRFLADWLTIRYGFPVGGIKAFYLYKALFGKLTTWIGFAKGEESRVASKPRPLNPALQVPTDWLFAVPPVASHIPKWRQLCVTHIYPLIELGINRQGCQEHIAWLGHTVPFPSNCMMCPFQREVEIIYLYRAYPQEWERWVEREKAKLAKFKDKKINLGVMGKLTLEEYLENALVKFGDWSMDRIKEYRFSHGHCVLSAY